MAGESRKKVLIVDDLPANVSIINALLLPEYRTQVALNGARALEFARSDEPPDLILLDVMMPEMDGYAVGEALRADPRTREIPFIFLTARTDALDEVRGFEVGAVDYITKPISPPTVLARVRTHLELRQSRDFLRDQNLLLESRVAERTREVRMLQEATIVALASLAETRDNETGNHIRRTQRYVRALAERLGTQSAEWVESLYRSSALHDIGKVGIPDRILLKPGKLTDAEFDVMKTHTSLGRDAIVSAEKHLEADSTFLSMAAEIAWCHHEKWDGSGYPRGLRGTDIPLSARLMAVADVYDALISKRVYKAAFPHEKAVAIIREGRGTHFDPDLVDLFGELADEFAALAQSWPDSDEEVARKARLGDA